MTKKNRRRIKANEVHTSLQGIFHYCNCLSEIPRDSRHKIIDRIVLLNEEIGRYLPQEPTPDATDKDGACENNEDSSIGLN
jgi:hypothetical protein